MFPGDTKISTVLFLCPTTNRSWLNFVPFTLLSPIHISTCSVFPLLRGDYVHLFHFGKEWQHSLFSAVSNNASTSSSLPCSLFHHICMHMCGQRGTWSRAEQTDVVEIKKNSWIASSSLLSVLIEARLVLSWELAAPADNITAAPSNKQRQKGFDWFTVPETKFTYTHHKRLLCLSSYNLVAVRSAIKLIFHQYGATKLV